MLRLLQRVFECAGLLALLLAGVAYLDSALVARRALAEFESAKAASSALIVPAPDRTSWSEKARRAHDSASARGPAPLAVLTVERLRLKAPVFEGTDRLTLNRGIGLVDGTAAPGKPGNTVLSAHRDSFFRPLKDIREGDVIEMQTLDGGQRYTVQEIFITDPLDVSVLEPTDHQILTLITCYPFYYIGYAPDRFIVRAVPQSRVESRNDQGSVSAQI